MKALNAETTGNAPANETLKLSWQEWGQVKLQTLQVQGLVALLVLLDIIIMFIDEPWNDEPSKQWITTVTWVILILFAFEMCLRIFAFGLLFFTRNYFLDLFDGIIIVASIVFLALEESVLAKGVLIARILRIARFIRSLSFVYKSGKDLQTSARRVTGENKKRFVDLENGFDLDLTYITERLIAMSVPATGCVQAFRNPITEVSRFFRTFHLGHFKIYNCCPELPYPSEPFEGSIRCFDIQDHTPPRIKEIVEFLKDARDFVDQALDDNVVVVHCRGGKGRTGSLCCSWLLYTKHSKDGPDVLAYFAEARSDLRFSDKLQGVDTPSQKRYVQCVDRMLKICNSYIDTAPQTLSDPPEQPITLKSLELVKFFTDDNAAKIASKSSLMVHVQQCESIVDTKHTSLIGVQSNMTWKTLVESKPISGDEIASGMSKFDLEGVQAVGDVRVTVYDHDVRQKAGPVDPRIIAGNEPGVLFYFIFHTAFVDFDKCELAIAPDMMDKAFKDKKGKRYNPNGITKLVFEGTNPWTPAESADVEPTQEKGIFTTGIFAGSESQAADPASQDAESESSCVTIRMC